MKAYLPPPQKSSNPLPIDYIPHVGFPMSIAAEAIKQGKAGHMRIYEAALRYGLGGLMLTAADLVTFMANIDITLSPAQAQRVLTDTLLFDFVDEHKTGKRGRPLKLYRMKPSTEVSEALGFDLGAVRDAPQLHPVDLSSCRRYKLAIFGRVMEVREEDSRQTQVRHWELSRQTMIRWTQETCDIYPQIERVRSDDQRYQWFGDDRAAELFLLDVSYAIREKPHKFWLEVTNHAGEIRKLPCSIDTAVRWLQHGMVTLCQQQPNLYITRPAYCDTAWFGELPY